MSLTSEQVRNAERGLLCGARLVIRIRPGDWRVICPTCEGGGTASYPSRELANQACVRDSAKPCPVKCGAR